MFPDTERGLCDLVQVDTNYGQVEEGKEHNLHHEPDVSTVDRLVEIVPTSTNTTGLKPHVGSDGANHGD